MCGIFGCVGELLKEKAYECISQISYRGPDKLNVKVLEGIVISHARLSILDVSDLANQPMSDPSGRYWIVYNGEVYNFLELRKELEQFGWKFKTNSDTEVVLYSYIEWGENFQNKCNGMWALVIWDNIEKRLFLSRDRFGVKPLYYYEQDNNFYFASEMKAFFPIMKERRINYQLLEKKQYFIYEATENCSIKGIKKILGGEYGYYKNGQLHLNKWWNTLEHLIKVPGKYEEQVELFRELFIDACKIRMRSDVPIGTALSGGVDSSTVVGVMNYLSKIGASHINKNWQNVFVASMPGTLIDETQYAEMAAKYIGLDIEKVMITAHITASKLLEYMYICEEPYITSPIPFMQVYGNIAKKGIKVTIDGHGADELFGGYEFDLFYAALEVKDDINALKEILKTYNDMTLKECRVTFEQLLDKIENIHKIFNNNDNEKKNVLGIFNKKLYEESHEVTLPTLLRCYDRYSMGNSLEIRMPFLDHRIVSFAFSIPLKAKINRGYTKKIVRDMAAPFMSKEVIYRKLKIGFNSPMTEWLQGDLKEFVLDTIHSKDFYECELFNSLDVNIKINEFYKCKRNTFTEGENIWTLLVPFLWKKAMQL